jgi:hypothetical protein
VHIIGGAGSIFCGNRLAVVWHRAIGSDKEATNYGSDTAE